MWNVFLCFWFFSGCEPLMTLFRGFKHASKAKLRSIWNGHVFLTKSVHFGVSSSKVSQLIHFDHDKPAKAFCFYALMDKFRFKFTWCLLQTGIFVTSLKDATAKKFSKLVGICKSQFLSLFLQAYGIVNTVAMQISHVLSCCTNNIEKIVKKSKIN